ncbi:MAG: hypothetical protein ACUVXI_17205 [bacterium]
MGKAERLVNIEATAIQGLIDSYQSKLVEVTDSIERCFDEIEELEYKKKEINAILELLERHLQELENFPPMVEGAPKVAKRAEVEEATVETVEGVPAAHAVEVGGEVPAPELPIRPESRKRQVPRGSGGWLGKIFGTKREETTAEEEKLAPPEEAWTEEATPPGIESPPAEETSVEVAEKEEAIEEDESIEKKWSALSSKIRSSAERALRETEELYSSGEEEAKEERVEAEPKGKKGGGRKRS